MVLSQVRDSVYPKIYDKTDNYHDTMLHRIVLGCEIYANGRTAYEN